MLELKKSLGQNLLIDKNIIKKIIDQSQIKNKFIIEIGPGTGNLTKTIIERKPKNLLLIEKDKRLHKILKTKFKSMKNCEVINNDILNYNFNSNLKEAVIFGNLPYNISTQILAKFIKLNKWPPFFEKIIFMFQKEVGDRIIAKPNTKNYSRISVLTNFRLEIISSFKISQNCFFPSPKVESKIIVFKPKLKINSKIRKIENLEKITHIFFSSKRKMINKAFSKIFKKHNEIAKLLNINLNKRPSELSFEEFYKITEKYEKVNNI